MRALIWFAIIFIYSTGQFFSQISPPEINPETNFHKDSVVIILSTGNSEEIRFTLDGSEPTYKSLKYTHPILITRTTPVRAKSFISDTIFSKTATSTFFINEKTTLPVLSITTDPANLFDSKIGIYVTGEDWRNPNYNYNWERPVHIELFEPDRTPGFSMDVGVQIFGEGSRSFPQKSLAIAARGIYGDGKINYKIFPDLQIDEFEGILLRNSGSDWNKAMLRDALIQTLVKDKNIDMQAYRPAILFINGRYWGIHDIRERSNEHFIASHHNIDADSIDLIKYFFPVAGDKLDYDDLTAYLKQNNMALQSSYDYIKTRIDIDAFLNYLTTEIYFDNTDWPGNNFKFWRPQRPGGKWRWILYDLDCGLDLKERESYKHASLSYATSPNGIDYPMPPWSNEVVNGLLKNHQFRNDLANRLADMSNTIFRSDSVLTILDKMKAVIEPEIARHFARWDSSLINWYKHIALIQQFVKNRLPYIQQDYITKLNLAGIRKLCVDISQQNTGRIRVNTIELSEFPLTGEYFSDVPLRISAIPEKGYKFKKWEELNSSYEIVSAPDSLPLKITAVFEPDTNYSSIVINEINYNSAPDFDVEDWTELYNPGTSAVDLSGWRLRDSDDQNNFIIPQNSILNPGSYLVLCRDSARFKSFFPEVNNITGNFSFGLNNAGEQIRLYNSHMIIVDSLTYDDHTPWPSSADGSGRTLELISPALDNSNPDSWGVSPPYGTPGRENSVYTYAAEAKDIIPTASVLYQNYPNPFNSATNISYSLKEEGEVEISVYNPLGRMVTILLNENKKAGIYKINFSPDNLTSGVYYIRLKTLKLVQVKKMLLLK